MYSEARVKANRKVVTGPQVEKLAYKLGDCGRGLNQTGDVPASARSARRLATPHRSVASSPRKHRLGDVLAAHQKARSYKQSGQGRTVG